MALITTGSFPKSKGARMKKKTCSHNKNKSYGKKKSSKTTVARKAKRKYAKKA